MRKRVLTWSLKIAGAVLLLLLVCVIASTWYISTHKKEIIASIQNDFHKASNGTLSVENVKSSLFTHFPNLTLTLEKVVIRDSLWQTHQHDLLNVEFINLSIRLFPLLKKTISVNKLYLNNGSIYFYTGSDQYSNTNILKKKSDNSSDFSAYIRAFSISNVKFTFQHIPKDKLIECNIQGLKGSMKDRGGIKEIQSYTKIYVTGCAFDLQKGVFLKDKVIEGNFHYTYDPASNALSFPLQNIKIQNIPVRMKALFLFYDDRPGTFNLDLSSDYVIFREVRSWMTHKISKNIDSIDFEKPISVQATIAGKFIHRVIPSVNITWTVKENNMSSPLDSFKNCSFSGNFYNGDVLTDTVFADEKSGINLYNGKIEWRDIPIEIDTLMVKNFIAPAMMCRVKAHFPVSRLNRVTEEKTFSFQEGNADVNMRMEGIFKNKKPLIEGLFGDISISNAAMTYTPRKIGFQKCNAELSFRGEDIYIRNTVLNTKNSQLKIAAVAKNFLGLYAHNPFKIKFDADLTGNRIDLKDFTSLIRQRPQTDLKSKMSAGEFSERLDQALNLCTAHFNIKIDSVIYKKFAAGNVKAFLTFEESSILLKNITLNHAGGRLKMDAQFIRLSNGNKFHVNTNLEKVKIDKLLYAFDNFGQRTLNPTNIKGTLTAQANIDGIMKVNDNIEPSDLKGEVKFSLDQGQLIGFRPLENLSRFVFKKKQLSGITFKKITNTLAIHDDRITIPPMYISSNLIDINMQGVYSVGPGTDISFEIPIIAFKKEDMNDGVGKRVTKGIRLYVRAKDDEQGNINFSLESKGKRSRRLFGE